MNQSSTARRLAALGILLAAAAVLFSAFASSAHVKERESSAPSDVAPATVSAVGQARILPAKVGDAGLLGPNSTRITLVVMMGIAAAALVAGARTATREDPPPPRPTQRIARKGLRRLWPL